jgi:hypothetical protein
VIYNWSVFLALATALSSATPAPIDWKSLRDLVRHGDDFPAFERRFALEKFEAVTRRMMDPTLPEGGRPREFRRYRAASFPGQFTTEIRDDGSERLCGIIVSVPEYRKYLIDEHQAVPETLSEGFSPERALAGVARPDSVGLDADGSGTIRWNYWEKGHSEIDDYCTYIFTNHVLVRIEYGWHNER